jgi:integrase
MPDPRGYIRRRGSRLEAVVVLLDGTKRARATGFEVGQEAEAQTFLDALLAELAPGPAAGVGVAPGSPTVRSWGEAWVAERKGRRLVSADTEEAHLRYHVFPVLGDVPLRALTRTQTLEWVRSLPSRTTQRSGERLSSRSCHHVAGTLKRLMAEAVDRELIEVSPCVWRAKRDLPKKRDKTIGKRNHSGFAGWEVQQFLHDERIDLDRRVMYGLDFLTGMRPGEVAARRWKDLDTTVAPLWRLDVGTAFESRHGVEKATKTDVEKIIPVHPELAELLRGWYATGWKEFMGRNPTPEDLLVPRAGGGPRPNYHSYKAFQGDVARLGLREGRTHYETRATFRSLALAGGAPLDALNLITHPSPAQASELYTRLAIVWPRMCAAVQAVKLNDERPTAPDGAFAEGFAVEGAEKEKARRLSGFGPSTSVSAEGIEPSTYGLRVHCSAS